MDSKWRELNIEPLLVSILSEVQSRPTAGHHLGPPFLTAYQLAIELWERYPEVAAALGYPLGGAGIGQPNSLAQYLGRELSRRIHIGEITAIEGALLSDLHLSAMSFRHGGDTIQSSLAGMGFDQSIFRAAKAR